MYSDEAMADLRYIASRLALWTSRYGTGESVTIRAGGLSYNTALVLVYGQRGQECPVEGINIGPVSGVPGKRYQVGNISIDGMEITYQRNVDEEEE